MQKFNNMLKKFVLLSVVAIMLTISSFIMVPNTLATGSITSTDLWGGNTLEGDIQTTTGLGNKDPREIAASVIKVVLGFLGIIAVLIVLYAGFLWMTAAGNDDKIATAKSMMSAGIIGLIIVLAAFGIATFVMTALVDATA